jgi:hypothetical protein
MNRIVYIDYLRNIANISRCFIHASIPYMLTKSPIWPVNDKGLWFFDFAVFEIHLFVMELFFAIAGFMFAMELSSKTISKIVLAKLKKIVLPLIVGLIILIPFVITLFELPKNNLNSILSYNLVLDSYASAWNFCIDNFFPTAHLWFLYYLIYYYIAAYLIKNILIKLSYFSLNKLLLIFVLISSLCMMNMQRYVIETPLSLSPDFFSMIHYFLFFLIGFIIYSNKKYISELNMQFNLYLKLGIIFALFAILPQLLFSVLKFSGSFFFSFISSFITCSASYLFVLSIWSYFKHNEFKQTKAIRYLTDSSYWVYLINMPIVAVFQLLLLTIDIPIIFKFLISFSGAFIISIISYECFVRYTFISSILSKRIIRKSIK